MANEQQEPVIRVIGFKTTYERRAKRGTDPLNEDMDTKGFLLDRKGNRVLENVAVDWVTWAPVAGVLSTQNTDRVENIRPDSSMLKENSTGTKATFMRARWAKIEPAYNAWKGGQEVPLNGTPLGAWPAVNAGQVDVLRHYGIRTVEEVAGLSEAQIGRVTLPGMRDLQKQARVFLDNSDRADSAKREADKDSQLEALRDRLAEMEKLLDQRTAPTNAEPADDEVTELRAQLDAKGITYDKRWAAPKLRAALMAEAA